VPNEEVINDVFNFIENLLRIKVLQVPELETYEYINEGEYAYNIISNNKEFSLSRDLIETIGESNDYIFFISRKYGLFNKIYYIEKSTAKIGELIMITQMDNSWI
jgi:hypothetical protein